ncbi:MAG: hypothetical protein K8L91_07935 [Anaerolineae bacterium]|nr:MAG: hypothetical protein F9K46_09025 [Anaerolineae bacterium]MBZ0316332.1 hypothetical protein [Anaerolineae bacterium]
MPATAQQISDFREDIGDVGSPPIFDDDAVNRIYDRAIAAYSDAETYEAEMRVIGIRQLLADAAKRVSYKQNQSSENMSDVFKHLKQLLDLWQGIRDDAASASSGGGAVWGSLRKKPSRSYEVPDS